MHGKYSNGNANQFTAKRISPIVLYAEVSILVVICLAPSQRSKYIIAPSPNTLAFDDIAGAKECSRQHIFGWREIAAHSASIMD